MKKAIFEDILMLGGFPLKVAILDDGTRVFEKESFEKFMLHLQGENVILTSDEIKEVAKVVYP